MVKTQHGKDLRQEDVIDRSSRVQRLILMTRTMLRALMAKTPTVFAASLLIAFAATAPAAADEQGCLTKEEQRAAITNGQAVTLATAIRAARVSVRGRTGKEVVKARLCREEGALRYVLTVLSKDGKVTRTSVDANSGKVVDAR
jgi:uncharacterized membrane protein YkoI